MNTGIIIAFIGVFFLIFGLLNYFIGLNGWLYIFQYLPGSRLVYWPIFWFIAFSYLLARSGRAFLPDSLRLVLTLIGAYWMAAMFYFLQAIVALKLLGFADRFIHFVPPALKNNPHFALFIGFVTVIFVVGVVVYGSWNARNPTVQHYDITIDKEAGGLQELHVVMVSDIHLGEIIHNGRLTKMVERINGLEPDVVLMPGDIVDEDLGPFIRQDMAASFRQLRPAVGIYAVPGNHEYIAGQLDKTVGYLEEAGIKVLRDNYVKVDDSFYIVGREDTSHPSFANGADVKSLSRVMAGMDKSLPIILLNHQPRGLAEAAEQGVDLQLSGHTHRGQLYPIQFITGRMFEKDWGYLKKDSLQLIVSSGFGTWGPPIRIGNRPEIVDITITFKPN